MPLNVRPGGSGSKERQMYLENEHGITIEVNVDVNVDYFMGGIRQISLVKSPY